MRVKLKKPRNWIAVAAHLRSGAGKHKDKSKYSRKVKHKKNLKDDSRQSSSGYWRRYNH